jgi:hypothetical protein
MRMGFVKCLKRAKGWLLFFSLIAIAPGDPTVVIMTLQNHTTPYPMTPNTCNHPGWYSNSTIVLVLMMGFIKRLLSAQGAVLIAHTRVAITPGGPIAIILTLQNPTTPCSVPNIYSRLGCWKSRRLRGPSLHPAAAALWKRGTLGARANLAGGG